MASQSPTVRQSLERVRVRIQPHAVFRQFPAETVVLDLESGLYHGLNPTGGRMIEVLDQASSMREAAAALAVEYRVTIERVEPDLVALCEGLKERGLIAYEDVDPQ
jgi:hypothetical protein